MFCHRYTREIFLLLKPGKYIVFPFENKIVMYLITYNCYSMSDTYIPESYKFFCGPNSADSIMRTAEENKKNPRR